MTSYFVATSTSDILLVMRSFRSHGDLETVAAEAESDVIGHYTRRWPHAYPYTPFPLGWDFFGSGWAGRGFDLGDGAWVMLHNYVPDASSCTDASLVLALKRTIADVVTWRLAKYGTNYLLHKNQSAPGQRTDFRDDVREPFPPGEWEFRLKPWDLRDAIYSG